MPHSREILSVPGRPPSAANTARATKTRAPRRAPTTSYNARDNSLRYLTHDVRGLLACAQLQIDILASHQEDKVRVRVTALQRAVDRLVDYCNCTAAPEIEPVDRIETCLKTVLDDVGSFLIVASSLASIETRIASDTAPLTAYEATVIHRILINLGRNAITAMGREGGTSLSITALSRNGELQIDVVDDGPGLPEAVLWQPFPAFHQPSCASRISLGLSSTRWLASTLGGDLFLVRSSRDGAAFQVILPLGALRQSYDLAARKPTHRI